MPDRKTAVITPGLELVLEGNQAYLDIGPVVQVGTEDVWRFLSQERISGITVDDIHEAFRRRRTGRVALGHVGQLRAFDAEAEVRINDDCLTATVRYAREGFGGMPIGRDKLMTLLSKQSITHGLDMVLIEHLVAGDLASGSYLIAQGTPAIDGHRAQLHYPFLHFRDEDEINLAAIRDFDGLPCVKAGDLLVEKRPAGLGIPGKSVNGMVLLPHQGKDTALPMGEGVVASADGLRLYAEIDGHAVMSVGRVDVLPTHEVMGNVDIAVGNIDFPGNVIIHGNVHNDLFIQAKGHVQIEGWVDNAQIKSGGNIVVTGGVQGLRALLKAQDNITAKYVENGQLEAGWNVHIQEAAMNARIAAGKKIKVQGRKGLIVGGAIRAGQWIEAKVVGSPLGTPTEIEVGVDSVCREGYLAAGDQLHELTTDLDRSETTLRYLIELRQKSTLSGEKAILATRLGVLVKRLRNDIERVEKRRNEFQILIDQAQSGQVVVQDTVHQGARITIGGSCFAVKDTLRGSLFKRDGANILVSRQ